MSDEVINQAKISFFYKTFWDHVGGLMKYWKSLLLVSVAAFWGIWTIVVAAGFWPGLQLTGWKSSLPVAALALMIGLLRPVYRYLHACPEGLENESKMAKRIAQLQRPFWEYRLARRLLQDKLSELSREQAQLLDGGIFIEITRQLTAQEYIDWSRNRIANLQRLVEIAERLLVFDFSTIFQTSGDRGPAPKSILAMVEKVRDFYARAVEFERDNQAVLPPEEFKRLHSLQAGWTRPIQDAVLQVFGFLDTVAALDPWADHQRISYTIEFGTPPNIDAYHDELKQLELGR